MEFYNFFDIAKFKEWDETHVFTKQQYQVLPIDTMTVVINA